MRSVVAEIDSRGIAAGKGYGSTVELVRVVARIPRSEARSRVDATADVLPGRGLGGAPIAPRLPHTAAAVAEHAIDAADVAVIRSVLARVPLHIGSAQRTHLEAELAKQARILDAGQLTMLGKRMLVYLDQDGRPPTEQPETRRFRDRDGAYELAGWLDREGAEIVRSALSPPPEGEPLDIGRASRTVPTAIRRACCATEDVSFRAVPSRPAGATSTT